MRTLHPSCSCGFPEFSDLDVHTEVRGIHVEPPAMASALQAMGLVAVQAGVFDKATVAFERLLQLAHEHSSPHWAGAAHANLGCLAFVYSQPELAYWHFQVRESMRQEPETTAAAGGWGGRQGVGRTLGRIGQEWREGLLHGLGRALCRMQARLEEGVEQG
jgi:hypothetical protein